MMTMNSDGPRMVFVTFGDVLALSRFVYEGGEARVACETAYKECRTLSDVCATLPRIMRPGKPDFSLDTSNGQAALSVAAAMIAATLHLAGR